MLNIDRLLKLASGAQVEPDPTDPTRPDHEKGKSGQQNLGGPWANPTDPTDPTKKTAVATIQDAGAETPLSFEPLPGQYWLDPVLNGFLPEYKHVASLSECRGYPRACMQCRALMADLETCLLGPEGGAA
ncbi:hypothetical protein MASR1M90_23550 [Desulfovibrionales bacterium]